MSSAQATTACSPESKLLILTPCIFVSTRSKIRSQKDKSRFEIRHYILSTKSGNDTLLRHTLEEADRRRLNPVAASLPPAAEGIELLEQARKATLGAAEKMPDYLVKEQIVRYIALGNTKNWQPDDHLSVA